MGLWDKLSTELRSAGKATQGAIDEGRIRLEIFRVRREADKAALALGYAIHRARKDGKEIEPDLMQRLSATLTEHETEAARLEADLAKSQTINEPPPQP